MLCFVFLLVWAEQLCFAEEAGHKLHMNGIINSYREYSFSAVSTHSVPEGRLSDSTGSFLSMVGKAHYTSKPVSLLICKQ